MREEERKYEVGPLFALPDLRGAAPEGGRITERPALTLRATYYDTGELRLARHGVSLRYRGGEDGPPWTVKLPSGEAHIRDEITATGPPDTIPEALASVVTAYTRGAPLAAVATLRTIRHPYLVTDSGGTVLAELVDDTVTVLDGETVVSRFRELEVERKAGDRSVLDRVERVLVAGGASPGEFPSKVVRALGPGAAEAPDLPPPGPLGKAPSAADVLTEALGTETRRLLAFDPAVRLRPQDPDALEQLRTACRRLRTDLRTFAPLFTAGERAPEAFAEKGLLVPLRELAGALRAVTGPESLRHRLAGVQDADALDPATLTRLDKILAALADQGRGALTTLLDGDPYPRLLDELVATARAPRLREKADAPATTLLPTLAAPWWRRLAGAAETLTPGSPERHWSAARRAARRLRRLARLASPYAGKPAHRLVTALDPVIGLLDVEREAQRATRSWLAASEAAGTDRELAILVGRLVEREHVLAVSARESFGYAWRDQKWRTATEWLKEQ